MNAQRRVAGVVLVAAGYSATALLGTARVDSSLTVACALVLGAAMVLVAQQLRLSAWKQFIVWFALLFLNFASVAVEGTLFAPALAAPSGLAVNLVRLALGSAAVAAVPAVLYRDGNPNLGEVAARRSRLGWAWRILAIAAIYVALYLVLGGLNYTFVTHPYYEAHAGGVTVPSATTVFAYEPFRGVLIALSLLPLTLALRSRVGSTPLVALVAGLMLFVVGGVVPLLPQSSLPLYLRIASLWEIFGQNFLAGAASAYVLIGTQVVERNHIPASRGSAKLADQP